MKRKGWAGRVPRLERNLYAFHDGALGGRTRRRFARALERDPALRRELGLLREMGALAREIDAGAQTPDLWDEIALRLPAEEARRAEERARRERLPSAWHAPRRWPRLVPLGAVAAAAVAVMAALLITRFWAVPEVGYAQGGVVRWVDSRGRNLLVVEDDGQTGATLIWLLDPATEGAALGGLHETV